MRTYRGPRVDATILGAASLLALAMGNGNTFGDEPTQRFEVVHPAAVQETTADPALTGLWLSADVEVRLQLNQDATYESSVVGRKRVARGTYTVSGATLVLRDATGLRTTVTTFDGNLEMAGHTLFKS